MKTRGEYNRRENKQVNQGIPLPHLQAWRRDALLTQKDLADAAGISKYTIMGIENGTYGGASLRSILKLADAFGITPQQLIHEQPPGRKARKR